MDLIERLRDLAALKHDDFSIGNEAADALEARDIEIERLRSELETERMRLTACGVIALANTPDSAKDARIMHKGYWSASAIEVANAVDREMALRAENNRLAQEIRDYAAQSETDQGIINADGKEIHFLREENVALRAELESLKQKDATRDSKDGWTHYTFDRPDDFTIEAFLTKPAAPQPAQVPDGWRLVNAGALQMVINALRRDAEEGKIIRGEMADELLAAPQPSGKGG